MAFDNGEESGRTFRGFLERDALTKTPRERSRAGYVTTEKYKLIAEPSECFSSGAGTKIICEGVEFELINAFEVYAGKKLSHRECILRRVEKNA